MNNKLRQKKNGTMQLPPEMEEMRLRVMDLELKARYWKAQYDIRYFTLEAEKVQPEYDKYLEAQQKLNEEQLKKLQKEIEHMNKEAEEGTVKVTGDPSEYSMVGDEGGESFGFQSVPFFGTENSI